MLSTKTTKKFNSRISSFSKLFTAVSLCLLLIGLYCSSTCAVEREGLINTAEDERQPLLSTREMEEGKPRVKSIATLQREINATLADVSIQDDLGLSRVVPIDAKPAEDGMNIVIQALFYSDPDYQEDINEQLQQAGQLQATSELNQAFLSKQAVAQATEGPLSQVLGGLVGQNAELIKQRTALMRQIQLYQTQKLAREKILQETLPVLSKAHEREASLRSLNTKFKIALGISIPLALATGAGALYLFLHYWGR